MKTTFSIVLCKFITAICRLFRKNGTVYPGNWVLKFDKHPLDDIIYPKYVVVVTGSSGKGSTVSMLAHILEGNGKKSRVEQKRQQYKKRYHDVSSQ